MKGIAPPAFLRHLLFLKTLEETHQHEFYQQGEIFICSHCRSTLNVMENQKASPCTSKHALHHFHISDSPDGMQGHSLTYFCCECHQSGFCTLQPALIVPYLFQSFRESVGRSHPAGIREDIFRSYLISVDLMLVYAKNVFEKNEERPIPGHNRNFRDFVSNHAGGMEMMLAMGFHQIDEGMLPPSKKDRLRYAVVVNELQFEIWHSLSREKCSNFTPKNPIVTFEPGMAVLAKRLGCKCKYTPSLHDLFIIEYNAVDTAKVVAGALSMDPPFETLGCTDAMKDDEIVWAYEMALKERPEDTEELQNALFQIASVRNSIELTQAASLTVPSKGQMTACDVPMTLDEAYATLQTAAEVDDEVVQVAYEVAVR